MISTITEIFLVFISIEFIIQQLSSIFSNGKTDHYHNYWTLRLNISCNAESGQLLRNRPAFGLGVD